MPYFRMSIPKALRSKSGRREFVCSLRTTETAEAEREAGALLAKTEELLLFARRASRAARDQSIELGVIFDHYRVATCSAGHALPSPDFLEKPPPPNPAKRVIRVLITSGFNTSSALNVCPPVGTPPGTRAVS